MDKIDAMRAFVTVADEGSFTKAANKMETSNQLVSKYVSQLEHHLNTRLFNRTTRKVRLTEAGEQCLQHTRHILESIDDMEGRIGEFNEQARGLLQISAPVSFATLHIAPLISDFQKAHPAVNIDLQLNDRKVDVIEEGFDVALRIGRLKNSSLIAKKIASIRLVICASPHYLEQYGTPEKPEELIPEHFLRYSYQDYSAQDARLVAALKRNNYKQESKLICNNGEILTEAAIAGQGYIIEPTFIVGEAIKQGKLKIILQEYAPATIGLYAVYPHRKLLATKLRAFIDFISQYYGATPPWDTL